MWQSATFHHIMRLMAKSIRVSDQLYALAEATSQHVHRSLAQQVEHWAELGRALEAAGVTTAQVLDVLSGNLLGTRTDRGAHARGLDARGGFPQNKDHTMLGEQVLKGLPGGNYVNIEV